MTRWPRRRGSADSGVVGFRVLDAEECWEHLHYSSLGRLAVADRNGDILVLPVNFTVEGATIMFRTAPGAGRDHLDRGPVTFQVDAVDPYRRSGWSVLAHGVADVSHEVGDADALPQPWAGAHRRHVVRIVVERVTGREVGPVTEDCDPRGYL
jgi:hypothetical protein